MHFEREKTLDESVEGKECLEQIKILQDYLKRGFVLHGSKVRVQQLVPKQAHDDRGRVVGNQNAVYGAKSIEAPVILALVGRTDPDDSLIEYTSDSLGNVLVTGRNISLSPGYIYVLPPDSFKDISEGEEDELVSYDDVVPIDIIEIRPALIKFIPKIILDKNLF